MKIIKMLNKSKTPSDSNVYKPSTTVQSEMQSICLKYEKQREKQPLMNDFRPVSVPLIVFDYPVQVNKHLFEISTLIAEWVQQYGSVFHFSTTALYDFLLVAAYAYPEASFDQLFSLSKLVLWGFAIDDHVLEKFTSRPEIEAYTKRFLHLFKASKRDPAKRFSIYCELLIDIFQDLRPYLSAGQQKRFLDEIRRYFDGTIEELTFQDQPELTMEEFIGIRERCVAGGVYELMVEMVCRVDMSAYERCQLFVRNKLAINHLLGWQNDLYSYNKERFHQTPTNLVWLVQRQQQVTTEQAVLYVRQMIQSEKQIFDQTSFRLINEFPEDMTMERYISGLRFWIQANLKSSIFCPRYYKYNKF